MPEIGTYLREQFEEIVDPIDIDELVHQLETGQRPVRLLVPQHTGRAKGWLIAAAAAAVVLVLGAALASLALRDEVLPADQPISSVSDDAYLEVAESFMDAWVAGDGEAAAWMFTRARSVDLFGAKLITDLSYLHNWFDALGYEFDSPRCWMSPRDPRVWRDQLSFLATTEGRDVVCPYTVENDITRALGKEPVPGTILLTVDDREDEWQIAVAAESLHFDSTADIWHRFGEWVKTHYPDDHDRIFLAPLRPNLAPFSVELWEQYVDEFAATPEAIAAPSTGPPSREEYGVMATTICASALVEYGTLLVGLDVPEETNNAALFDPIQYGPAPHAAAVRISEDALAQLRALDAPEEDRAALDEAFALMEQEIAIHRQLAAFAAQGDIAQVDRLTRERVDLTHRKDNVVPYGGLVYCPVNLGA